MQDRVSTKLLLSNVVSKPEQKSLAHMHVPALKLRSVLRVTQQRTFNFRQC